MDDVKIVALYWDRNEDAITETNSKYGKYCFKIADNILSDFHEAEECVTAKENVENEIITHEMAECINYFLASLPKKQRIIFLKRYFYVEEIDEIADMLGMSKNSVAMTLSRIRKKLKKHLMNEGYIDE